MELDDTSPYWTGEALHELMQRLFPICRSITGKGVRETLDIIGEHIPLERFEVPSGTQVFDWEVPLEWNINEAWIKDTDGRKVVDFRDHNLHVMSYSQSVDETLPLDALKPHLHSLPDQPDLIPYRTSYYADNWGFCLTHNQLAALPAGDYRVKIDSTHSQGALSYGEYFLPGETDREIVLYTHVCHPSLCNDNLSGITIGTALGQWLGQRKRRYSYRIVFAPGTIGSITWLAQNQDRLDKVDCALVAVLLGGPGNFTYKRSRFGSAYIDRVVELALRDSEQDHEIVDFSPYGYDERQFNSPGIKIPAGRITRSPTDVRAPVGQTGAIYSHWWEKYSRSTTGYVVDAQSIRRRLLGSGRCVEIGRCFYIAVTDL